MDFSRRRFLAGSAALTAPLALAACGGFAPAGSQPSQQAPAPSASRPGAPTPSSPGSATSSPASSRPTPGTTVNLNAVPYEQMFSNIDAQIQAGNPPDVFRVPYYTFGSYAGAGQLLDLTPHLPAGFADRFTPQAWAAVQNAGKPYGVPHHTDTSVILYNKTLLDAAGVTSVPTEVGQAWTWPQLLDVAGKLRSSLPGSKFPMAYNWQGNGVTRWLSLLFQADGRFLGEDLKTPAIDSDAGRAAIDFSKRFFTDKLVPANDSVKSTTYAADTWYSQTAAMVWGGAFMVPDADKTADFEWGTTFAPRNVRAGSDFGGNALVATAKAKDPALAAKFLDFVTEAGVDEELLHRGVAAADPRGPRRERHQLHRAAGDDPGLPRPGRAGAGERLRPGGLAGDEQDHHRAQGPARAGVRRRPEHRGDDRRAHQGHRRRHRRAVSQAAAEQRSRPESRPGTSAGRRGRRTCCSRPTCCCSGSSCSCRSSARS